MKIGVRKPSFKKSFKAMTTGSLKRKIKKAIIPGYGKKGIGIFKNPKKSVYNKIYNKTTVSLRKVGKNKNKGTNLILDIVIWSLIVCFFVGLLPFYLIYYIFKKK